MEGRTRVLGPGDGRVGARLMFVAEAPGRLGADKSGVPLSGDRTGQNFAALLEGAGIDRAEVFVTNAVLCNPRNASGNNAPPSKREIRNCSRHLADTIAFVGPQVVVALGVVALRALGLVEPHDAVLARDVGNAFVWHRRLLVPLYHPGPRACIRRPLGVQAEDYRRLAALLGGQEAAPLARQTEGH
jgi:uracil-DNA glycosylase family 4